MTDNAVMLSGANIEHLRTIFSHDLKYWKAIADNVLIWALAVAGLAAVVVGISTYLSMKWGDEISNFNERSLASYKLSVDGKVADAKSEGIKAGEAAGSAILQAARLNVKAASLEKEAEGLRLELSNVREPLVERRLTKKQIDTLVKSLTGKKLATVIAAPSPDREINTYAKDFIAAFGRAGTPFNVTIIAGAMQEGGVNVVPDGLNVSGDDGPNKTAVETALKNARIPFGHEALPPWIIKFPGAAFIIIGQRKNLPH